MIITFDNSTSSLSTRIMSSLPSLGLGRQSAGMILMVLERLCQRKPHEKPKKDKCRPSLANAIFYRMSHPWSMKTALSLQLLTIRLGQSWTRRRMEPWGRKKLVSLII